MSKKNDSQPTGGHEDAASPSSTMVSVRFSEEELAQVKQAAKDRPLAAFIRRSALHASVEAINAAHELNGQMIQQVAKEVACRIRGVGDLLHVYELNGVDVSETFCTSWGDIPMSGLEIEPRKIENGTLSQLLSILEEATHPFVEQLLIALKSDGENTGFKAAIKKDAE